MMKRYARFIHPIETIIIFTCCLVSAVFVYGLGTDSASAASFAGMSTDVICLVISAIFYMAIYLDKHHSSDTELFLLMFMLESLMIASDVASWYVNANVDLLGFNLLSRYSKNILLFVFTFVFWSYLKHSVNVPRKVEVGCNVVVFFLFVSGIILIATNWLSGWLFTVDSEGVYRRGEYLYVFYALMIMMLGSASISVFASNTPLRNKLVAVIYLLITVAFSFVQFYRIGQSLIYLAPLIILIIVHINMYIARCEEVAQLQAELKMDRYELMISQVQPHFLYNSLTSIIAIKGNPPLTVEAIGEFSTVLRRNLDKMGDEQPVSFQSELDHAESYLFLEKLRFKDRLNIEWDIGNTKFMFPPMTLQPLIENAVRHGVTIKPGGGTITISCGLVENGHIVKIIDDGMGFDTEVVKNENNPHHLGLKNTARRLAQFVGGTLEVQSAPGVGTTVTIFVPFGGRRRKVN